MLALFVLAYIGYTAGANPVSPDDLYTAWYLGALSLVSGALIVLSGKRRRRGAGVMPAKA
ncbi:hypothetical protein D9M70_623570 [compost metagenome]